MPAPGAGPRRDARYRRRPGKDGQNEKLNPEVEQAQDENLNPD